MRPAPVAILPPHTAHAYLIPVQVAGLPSFVNLRSLLVHGALLTRVEGLDRCPSLEELNLSSNHIEIMEGLSGLPSLRVLNLARPR